MQELSPGVIVENVPETRFVGVALINFFSPKRRRFLAKNCSCLHISFGLLPQKGFRITLTVVIFDLNTLSWIRSPDNLAPRIGFLMKRSWPPADLRTMGTLLEPWWYTKPRILNPKLNGDHSHHFYMAPLPPPPPLPPSGVASPGQSFVSLWTSRVKENRKRKRLL